MASRIMKSFIGAVLAATISPALAQDYPTKPVVVVIPFAAGGPTDTLGRHLAQVLTKQLKQQVLIGNTVGAGGTIGVARSPGPNPTAT